MYREFLHHHHVAPIAVSTARHALTIASHAAVIVTGIRLSGDVDGIDLIKRLRADERTRHTPIIVLTTYWWNTERQRAEDAGCDVFLTKPCLPEDLLREVRRLLASATTNDVRRNAVKAILAADTDRQTKRSA